ncbi:MAG: hypothetical protein QXV75_07840 [Candidatus Bathyarchaeia archaeon]
MSTELEKVLAKARELAESIERDRQELIRKFEELSKRIEEDAKRFSTLTAPPSPSSPSGRSSSSKR